MVTDQPLVLKVLVQLAARHYSVYLVAGRGNNRQDVGRCPDYHLPARQPFFEILEDVSDSSFVLNSSSSSVELVAESLGAWELAVAAVGLRTNMMDDAKNGMTRNCDSGNIGSILQMLFSMLSTATPSKRRACR